jgi:hypothetical protein
VGRPSLAAAGGEVVGESVDSGVAEGVDSFVAVEDTVGLGVKACVGSSGDLSAGGEGEEGVDSGVAVGESEGLGGGGGGEVAGIPVGVFSSQLARRRPVNAMKMNGCVFILKISTHGCWRYSRGKEEENSEFRSQNFGLRI